MELSLTSQHSHRRLLYLSLCAMCRECGFQSAEKIALETLLEMLQSVICEIGRNTRAFCELSGRVEPLVGDLVIALIELGITIDDISTYALRPSRSTLQMISQMPKQSTPKILQAGDKRPLSSYIPEHLPKFPDPHAYIWTPTHKQPVTEYESIREKSSSQKRDVERALTRFMANTCDKSITHCLFSDDQMRYLFPLISLKITPNPYLNALLPKDQIFDDNDSDVRTKSQNIEKKSKVQPNEGNEQNKNVNDADESNNAETKTSSVNPPSENDLYDNPYLRPPKPPSKKRTRKHAFNES